MLARALELPRCESPDCKAVAIRGAYCAEHAQACTGCWQFFAASDLTDEQCARCRRQDCAADMAAHVEAQCWCGAHS